MDDNSVSVGEELVDIRQPSVKWALVVYHTVPQREHLSFVLRCCTSMWRLHTNAITALAYNDCPEHSQ